MRSLASAEFVKKMKRLLAQLIGALMGGLKVGTVFVMALLVPQRSDPTILFNKKISPALPLRI